jgi:hypothetical protein
VTIDPEQKSRWLGDILTRRSLNSFQCGKLSQHG